MKYLKNYNTFILESSFYNSDYSNMKLTTLIGLDIPDFVDNYFWCFGNLDKHTTTSRFFFV